jgi:hypothetical protein
MKFSSLGSWVKVRRNDKLIVKWSFAWNNCLVEWKHEKIEKKIFEEKETLGPAMWISLGNWLNWLNSCEIEGLVSVWIWEMVLGRDFWLVMWGEESQISSKLRFKIKLDNWIFRSEFL